MVVRRTWDKKLGGYTYDGVTLTPCQCNLSAGKCKCGLPRGNEDKK